MARKDCLFLISYCITFVCFIMFIVSFASEKWISYEEGHRGLWKECTKKNLTDLKLKDEAEFKCASTTLAEGPAFLDVSRTLSCFALVAYIIAVYGYIVSESGDVPHTCKGQMKARLQEISYIIAGVLGIIADIVYALNYYDYHSDELELTNPDFDFAFILSCVATSVTIVFSITLACARETGFKKTIRKKTRSFRLEKAPDKPQANKRNMWLKNKGTPTPVNQKNESIIVVEDKDKEVPIKTKNLARFILPITVIQAARRLQKGASREDDEKFKVADNDGKTNVEHKDLPMNINNNDKYKGIFMINIDNRKERSPSPAKETPRVRIQTPRKDSSPTSSGDESSSDTSSSSEDEIGVNVGGRAVTQTQRGKGDALIAVRSHSSKTEDESKIQLEKTVPEERKGNGKKGDGQRPSVRRSRTTLGRDEEPEWTRYTTLQTPQRPPPPRKTLSHGPVPKKTSKRPKQTTIPESNVNIYTLLPEPGPVRPSTSIDYEEVVAGRGVGDGNHPQPLTTHQSTIYRPYS